jgi:hypothetical protein
MGHNPAFKLKADDIWNRYWEWNQIQSLDYQSMDCSLKKGNEKKNLKWFKVK